MPAKEIPVLPLVAASKDVKSHPVLDAAGHVQVLGLAVQHAAVTTVEQLDREQGRVADKARQTIEAAVVV